MTDVTQAGCGLRYVFTPWEVTLAGWELVADLETLREEFNKLAPNRDKASDGAVGDLTHQREKSDHNPDETGATPYEDSDSINEVHAIDVDDDLRKAGWTMQKACDIIRLRHKNGSDNRLQNIIYNRQITSRSWGWTWQPYNGASAHTEHAHFSSRYGSGTVNNPEANTKPWGLLEQLAKESEDTDMEAVDVWNVAWGRDTRRETAGDRLAYVDATVEELKTEVDEIKATLTDIKNMLSTTPVQASHDV